MSLNRRLPSENDKEAEPLLFASRQVAVRIEPLWKQLQDAIKTLENIQSHAKITARSRALKASPIILFDIVLLLADTFLYFYTITRFPERYLKDYNKIHLKYPTSSAEFCGQLVPMNKMTQNFPSWYPHYSKNTNEDDFFRCSEKWTYLKNFNGVISTLILLPPSFLSLVILFFSAKILYRAYKQLALAYKMENFNCLPIALQKQLKELITLANQNQIDIQINESDTIERAASIFREKSQPLFNEIKKEKLQECANDPTSYLFRFFTNTDKRNMINMIWQYIDAPETNQNRK